jgi:hypothetical protein
MAAEGSPVYFTIALCPRAKSPFLACTFTNGEDGTQQVDNMALSGEVPQKWESQQQDS